GELAVGLLDRGVVGVLGDAERGVEVLLHPVLSGHGASLLSVVVVLVPSRRPRPLPGRGAAGDPRVPDGGAHLRAGGAPAPSGTVWSVLLGSDDRDARGAHDALADAVAGLDDEVHRGGGGLGVGLVHERLVDGRVELLADLPVPLDAELLQARVELLRDGGERARQLTVLARAVDVVEHRQERGEHVLHAPRPRGLLVAQRAVAVVREARPLALERLEVLRGLRLRGEDLGVDLGLARRLEVEARERVRLRAVAGPLRRRGLARGAGLRRLGVDLALVGEVEGLVLGALTGLMPGLLLGAPCVVRRHFLSSSSCTISASTTSSSGADEAPAAADASSAAAPGLPAACSCSADA